MSFTTITTQLIEYQKSNFTLGNCLRESLLGAAAKTFDLNAAAYRSVLQRGAEVSRNLSGSMDAQDAVAIYLGSLAPALEEFAGYSRDACGIASGAGVEILQIAEAHVARLKHHMAQFAEIADPDSPFGSTSAAWMFRGIVNTTQSGLEAGLRSARQVASCADAYFGAYYPVEASVVQDAAA